MFEVCPGECGRRSYQRLLHSEDEKQPHANGTIIRSLHRRTSTKLSENEDRIIKEKYFDHLQQTGTHKWAQSQTIPHDNNKHNKQPKIRNYAGGALQYLPLDTSHSAQLNKHNAASAKKQVLSLRFAVPKYPRSLKKDINLEEGTNVLRDPPKVKFECIKYRKIY